MSLSFCRLFLLRCALFDPWLSVCLFLWYCIRHLTSNNSLCFLPYFVSQSLSICLTNASHQLVQSILEFSIVLFYAFIYPSLSLCLPIPISSYGSLSLFQSFSSTSYLINPLLRSRNSVSSCLTVCFYLSLSFRHSFYLSLFPFRFPAYYFLH